MQNDNIQITMNQFADLFGKKMNNEMITALSIHIAKRADRLRILERLASLSGAILDRSISNLTMP